MRYKNKSYTIREKDLDTFLHELDPNTKVISVTKLRCQCDGYWDFLVVTECPDKSTKNLLLEEVQKRNNK